MVRSMRARKNVTRDVTVRWHRKGNIYLCKDEITPELTPERKKIENVQFPNLRGIMPTHTHRFMQYMQHIKL